MHPTHDPAPLFSQQHDRGPLGEQTDKLTETPAELAGVSRWPGHLEVSVGPQTRFRTKHMSCTAENTVPGGGQHCRITSENTTTALELRRVVLGVSGVHLAGTPS
jgi:hypothetical protein